MDRHTESVHKRLIDEDWGSAHPSERVDQFGDEALKAYWNLSQEIDCATQERISLEFYRSNLAGYVTEMGDCGAATVLKSRLHDADLALDQIRLDLATVSPKLKRAKWVKDEQQTRHKLRFEKLVKLFGLPVAVFQIVAGLVHIIVGTWNLSDMTGITPLITIGTGTLLLLVGIVIAIVCYRQTS